jgi:peptide/nickel transport system permease protein
MPAGNGRRFALALGKGLLRALGLFLVSTFVLFILLTSAPQEYDSFGLEELGLADANLLWRYLGVLRETLQLDLGLFGGMTARAKILIGLRESFLLLGLGLLVLTLSGMGLGLLFTYKRESRLFRTLHTLVDFLSLMPAFILGYLVGLFLFVNFQVSTDMAVAGQKSRLLYGVLLGLAAIVLASADGTLTEMIRQVRAELERGRQARHIHAVRANGLNLIRHMFRAGLVTLLIALNLRLVHLMGAVIVVEMIFNLQGLGLLTLEGIRQHNYLLVFAISTIFILAVLVVQGLNAVILARLNPLAESGGGDEA